MATEYLKVIARMGYIAIVVGRGEGNVNLLRNLYSDFTYYSGGIEKYLASNEQIPSIAINTVNWLILVCRYGLIIVPQIHR